MLYKKDYSVSGKKVDVDCFFSISDNDQVMCSVFECESLHEIDITNLSKSENIQEGLFLSKEDALKKNLSDKSLKELIEKIKI